MISLVDTTITPGVEGDNNTVEEKTTDPFQRNGDDNISVTPRRLPDGKLKELKKEKKFWYADSSFLKKNELISGKTPFFMRDWVKTVFWILLVGGFAAALAWYLYSNNVRLFRKKDTTVKSDNGEELPEDIFAIDYNREVEKALANKDYRMAVRLQFLDLLRLFSEKNVIQYRQDRTNLDYLFQLNNRPYYPLFFKVVRHYEYSWYGRFEVTKDSYSLIDMDFKTLKQELN
jgi:hypothetical protein